MARAAPASIDAYIAAFPPKVRAILRQIRRTLRAAVPDAEECISYRMPTFRLGGVLVHFAAFKNHIGVFPPVSGDAKLLKALAPYTGEKGNLRFPLDRPMRHDLIRRIAELRARQLRSKARGRAEPSAPARQLAGFIAKFDPASAKLIRACRAEIRELLPTAVELVYDNYNFLAIGFSASERASDCVVSLAAAANGVGLSFYYGATLPDPHGVLLGSGNQNRFVRLPTIAPLRSAPVLALIRAAVAQAKTPLPGKGGGATIIKSISAKQRPRRRSVHAG